MTEPGLDEGFLSRIAARIRSENEAYEQLAASRKKEAEREAARLASLFASADPGIVKIVLFGSALPGRSFRPDSDIDLAVSGGDIARLEAMASDSAFRVDIVDMENLAPGIRGMVDKEGLVLYEKNV
jgi:predicted nucleotidyltransferase